MPPPVRLPFVFPTFLTLETVLFSRGAVLIYLHTSLKRFATRRLLSIHYYHASRSKYKTSRSPFNSSGLRWGGRLERAEGNGGERGGLIEETAFGEG